ncbi:MAG: AAA family ATPase [Vannielia sp.]|uniref:AAA family ATPase n=1 Tax=Vannielia sp. TaxID=2813045 RepID=UPI003B8BEE06
MASGTNLHVLADARHQNLEAALESARYGKPVIPVHWKTKRPLIKDWRNQATTDELTIRLWWGKFRHAMPANPAGLVSNHIVVDYDIREDKNGVSAALELGVDPYQADLVVKTPNGVHAYYSYEPGIKNSTSAAGIDIRSDGGYAVTPGAVSAHGTYEIAKGDLWLAKHFGLSMLPATVKPERSRKPTEKPAGSTTIEELRQALSFIPNDEDYGEWLSVLMALHHATGGSDEGLALALGWSAGHKTFSKAEVEDKWRSFKAVDGPQVTASTLFAQARRHGWQAISADRFESIDDDADCDVSDQKLGEPVGAGLYALFPEDCKRLGPREYIVKGLIGPGQIGCIFGEPGSGKSVISPYLGYCIAQGGSFFGRKTVAGLVYYVACEDDTGLAYRSLGLQAVRGDTSNFILIQGGSDFFSAGEIKGRGSPQLEALLKAVRERKPRLVVFDTLAAGMPGLEENDAAGMNRVIQIARALAMNGTTVVFVHHGTKADGSTPRGHSLFNGALDFSIMVKRADKNGVVRCVLRKNRNGSPDMDIAFRIEPRVVGADVDGDEITAPVCKPLEGRDGAPSLALTPSAWAALGCLESLVSPDHPYTPLKAWRESCLACNAVSAAEKSDSRGKAFKRALTLLTDEGKIAVAGDEVRLCDPIEDKFDAA